MTCGRCGLALSAGAEHRNEGSCIVALRVELEKRAVVTMPGAIVCAACSGPIPAHLCPPCAVRALGRGLWDRVGTAVERKALQKFEEAASYFRGGGFSGPCEIDEGGEEQPRPGKRFKR